MRPYLKKILTLFSVLVVLQPFILNAEAITLVKNEEVEQSQDKEFESSSEDTLETTTEIISEELQETEDQVTIEVSSAESDLDTSENDTTDMEREEVEEVSEIKETESTEDLESTEDTENSLEAQEEADKKAFDALRAEGRANHPEKTKEQIIEALPEDAITLSGVFDTEAFSNVSEATAHIETTPSGADVVFMTEAGHETNSGGQSSALWSNEDFKVDMTKTFEAEMDVYLGNSRLGSADGMTFTFQNDNRKTKAIGKEGGGLGVYGNVDKKRPGTMLGRPGNTLKDFLNESVQKSFTIEMDTTANEVFDGGSYKASSWGGQALKKQQHVLAGYPSLSEFSTFKKEKFIGVINTGRWKKSDGEEQYKMVTKDWLATGFSRWQPYMMNNAVSTPIFKSSTSNVRGPWLSDGVWHKLDIKYTPKDRRSASSKYTVDAPELLVTFDGVTKDYTGRFAPFANGLVTESNPYMYWGLTAATGETAATQAVALKKMPKTSGVTHVADIKKDNKSIIGTGEYAHVQSGDVLSYESTSVFKSGNNEFEKPVYVNTIDSGLEYVADSFEVKEPGSNEFMKVPASDYDVEGGQLVYREQKNLSKPNPTLETRFKVKVKPTYYETLIEEESRLSSAETFLIARQDLSYIIDPIDVIGKVTLDGLTDNPDITKEITGKITTEKAYANKQVTISFYGDKEASKIEPMKLKLDSKGEGVIKGVLDKHLTAENIVDVIVQEDQGEVLAVGQGVVEDKTASTADENPLEYFVVKNIKELPFVAEQLLDNIQDSNPNLSIREEDDTGADITATFKNVDEIKSVRLMPRLN